MSPGCPILDAKRQGGVSSEARPLSSALEQTSVILSAAKNPCISLLFSLVLLFPPTAAHPQGCAQCRESLGQTPIRTQQAYRRAITLMVLAGTTVFTASFIALRRYRS